ncbi:unnamed protein product [Rhizopus stolonifer]
MLLKNVISKRAKTELYRAYEAMLRYIKNLVKYTEECSKFIEEYSACIANIITELLCSTFDGLFVNPSTVYRHITENLEFTLIRTQARPTSRNLNDAKEQRR